MSNIHHEPLWQRGHVSNINFVPVDAMAFIYNESLWRVSKVSPLNNLQYSALKLKQYASKIRQHLVSLVVANSSIKYTVRLEAQPGLKYCKEDSDGVMITIESSQETSKTKVAYVAILLSWGVSCSLSNTIHLPYMLERGEQKVGTSVKASLQIIFDCNIKQLNFSQNQLLQFGFNFVDHHLSISSNSTEPFTLVYKTPQVEHKDKLKLGFEIGDIQIIWNGIKNEELNHSEVLNNSEVVKMAYQILQNQILSMLMLDITPLELVEVTLPKAEVKSSGIVKMKTREIINVFFTVLNTCIDNPTELYNVVSDCEE